MKVTQQAALLQQILETEANELARETGFIQRERAFNGADFAQALIFGRLQRPDERVEGFVQILGRREVTITASGLCQRFTQEAATFLQRLLERLAAVQMQAEAVDIALLRRFSGVIVEDSSSALLQKTNGKAPVMHPGDEPPFLCPGGNGDGAPSCPTRTLDSWVGI